MEQRGETSGSSGRAKPASPGLLVLDKWETFCGWLLQHTGRWNKVARFLERIEPEVLLLERELLSESWRPGLPRCAASCAS